MSNNAWNTVSRFIGKTKSLATVQLRKRALSKAEDARNRRVTEMYGQLYEANMIHTTLNDVYENLERFVATYFYDWRSLDRVVSPNSTRVDLSYVLRFTEQFRLGEWGCLLEPVSVRASMKVNCLFNNYQTETVAVPYELFFRMRAEQMSEMVYVQTETQEAIDRLNQVPYLRNGDFRAPSMLATRFPIAPGQHLIDFLHNHCHENRPSIQEWFSQKATQQMREIADLNCAVDQAQQALLKAQTTYVQG
jgi:hypothetical protein